MSNSIERVDAPSGATHKTPKGTYMKHAAGAWFEWLYEWVKVDSGVHVNVNQLTEISGDEMNLKKLTQDVPTAVQSSFESQLNEKRNFAELHDKPFTPCRASAPTAADIDWIEGAAYWCKPFPPIQPSGFFINAGFTQVHDGVSWVQALPQVKDLQSGAHSLNVIRRESITDVARSIEAARVAEQSERTYPHYFKDVSAVDAIDLYHVARLYDITDPALFHAFKKIACAGKRGAKDQAQDVQESIDALKRWQELSV